jgi:putative DNA-invertase from lambdoid prophage Rac
MLSRRHARTVLVAARHHLAGRRALDRANCETTSHRAVSEGLLSQTYFYINGTSASHFPEQELIRLDKAGYTVALNRVAVDGAPPCVAAANRTVLNGVMRRIAAGDRLVVLELSCLGCSVRDVLTTLLKCRKEKISVRCVELGNVDLASRPEPQAVKTLRAIVRMETRTRSERSSTSLRLAQQSGRSTGRPVSLSREHRERVIGLLHKGLSVSEIARQFDTSRQTIMRIRASSGTAAAAGNRRA